MLHTVLSSFILSNNSSDRTISDFVPDWSDNTFLAISRLHGGMRRALIVIDNLAIAQVITAFTAAMLVSYTSKCVEVEMAQL